MEKHGKKEGAKMEDTVKGGEQSQKWCSEGGDHSSYNTIPQQIPEISKSRVTIFILKKLGTYRVILKC